MIYYITQTLINSANAQSVQIRKTVESLHQSGQVTLISPLCELEATLNFNWVKLRLFTYRGRVKYLNFLLQLLVNHRHPRMVYTRDILVALLYVTLGAVVIYEAHQKPSAAVNFIVGFLKNFQKFKVVTISDALRKYYLKNYKLPNDRILTIRSAVDFEKYQNTMKCSDLIDDLLPVPDQKILLHSGSIGPGRGTDLFSGILKEFPNIVILQVGGSDSDLLVLKNKIRNKRFVTVSRVECEDSLIALQLCADFSLFPMSNNVETAWCCSPMKIFEYAALGKPLVSTTVGAVSELINEQNAFTFNSDQPETLMDAIRGVLRENTITSIKTANLKTIAVNNTWKLRAETIRLFFGEH